MYRVVVEKKTQFIKRSFFQKKLLKFHESKFHFYTIKFTPSKYAKRLRLRCVSVRLKKRCKNCVNRAFCVRLVTLFSLLQNLTAQRLSTRANRNTFAHEFRKFILETNVVFFNVRFFMERFLLLLHIRVY